MSHKKKADPIGANVGTSSLLLVFVILCLVSFATLSIVSANADQKLNDKIIERTASYYDACNQAEEKLMNIDNTLKTLYESGVSREDYYAQAGENIEFAIPVSDVQTLNVCVRVNYPGSTDSSFYSISRWKLESTGTLDEDITDTLPVAIF